MALVGRVCEEGSVEFLGVFFGEKRLELILRVKFQLFGSIAVKLLRGEHIIREFVFILNLRYSLVNFDITSHI